MLHLYDSSIPSGNSYKIHLILAYLQIPYEVTNLDILTTPPDTRKPEYLAINPNGRIPALRLDDAHSTILCESNAILYYLAEGSAFLPTDRLARAQVLQWLFFEQYSHEPYVAVVKACMSWIGFGDRTQSQIDVLKSRGQDALDVMERHLDGRECFVGETLTIADVALYVYTFEAAKFGFRLGENTERWLERVKGQPGHVAIKKDPLGKVPA